VRLTRTADAVLEDLRLENDGLGIKIVNGRGTTVRRSVIEGTRGRQGILVESSPDTTIEDAVVHAPKREGIALRNSPSARIVHVTVDGSQGGDGILVYRSRQSHRGRHGVRQRTRGVRVSSSFDLVLVRATANDNGSAGLRIERSSLSTTWRRGGGGKHGRRQPRARHRRRAIAVQQGTVPADDEASRRATTSTTAIGASSTTTTTTTVSAPPLADASWRFYVRITTGDPFPHNVDVPAHFHGRAAPRHDPRRRPAGVPSRRSGDGQRDRGARRRHVGPTHGGVDAYLRSHPADYPGFGTIVEIRWAKRVILAS